MVACHGSAASRGNGADTRGRGNDGRTYYGVGQVGTLAPTWTGEHGTDFRGGRVVRDVYFFAGRIMEIDEKFWKGATGCDRK